MIALGAWILTCPGLILGELPPTQAASSGGPAAPDPLLPADTLIAPGVRVLHMPPRYWELYPRNEDVSIASIQKARGGIGVELSLRSDLEGFAHFLYSCNGEPERRSRDGRIQIRFRNPGSSEISSITTVITAVDDAGTRSPARTILINYYPQGWYQSQGYTEGSHVTVQMSDLPLAGRPLSDLVLQQPGKEAREYARTRWGHLVVPDRADYENAVSLARAILSDLEPHRGTPSDRMLSLMPFQQYERAMAGEDRVFCRNIVAIYSYACNALDIACRMVGMTRQLALVSGGSDDYGLALAPTHVAAEIYSRRLNQWVWIDPFLNILGAYLAEEGPLDAVEFQMFLNNPNRFAHLRVVVFDPATGGTWTVRVTESGQKLLLQNYYKRDQQFFYYARETERARP